ncbi:biopolymer transporter ExbD [Marivivens donghaensis]|uniref:Biopolymer transporter ExbD n=1 Tax=Marivivens donghaensis TaxID=1699413 RepID=A0ABX0W0A5_9RHOB|nr:biopolymer transporter ExbD [Marivivens donghaensis]NIY73519.1 biopolymer transporter ExbD [Marivivens donghaensis]
MKFAVTHRKQPLESVIPMINVVFLLLIFFLMSARMSPPEPVEVTPPQSSADDPADLDAVLYVGADGVAAYRDARDAEALTAYAAALCGGDCDGAAATLRADTGAPAVKIAALLTQLAGLGIADVELVTQP